MSWLERPETLVYNCGDVSIARGNQCELVKKQMAFRKARKEALIRRAYERMYALEDVGEEDSDDIMDVDECFEVDELPEKHFVGKDFSSVSTCLRCASDPKVSTTAYVHRCGFCVKHPCRMPTVVRSGGGMRR